MKVVLLQDVKKMGKKGDIIEVSDSYGRNVLIRRGLGKEGSVGNLNTARQQQASRDHKAQVAADEAVIMAAQAEKGDIEAEGSYRRGRTDFRFGHIQGYQRGC